MSSVCDSPHRALNFVCAPLGGLGVASAICYRHHVAMFVVCVSRGARCLRAPALALQGCWRCIYIRYIYIYGEVEDMGCARWVCIVLEVVGRLRAIMYTMCIPKRNNVVVVWWQKFCLFSQTDIVFARYTAHVCICVYVWVCRYTRWHLWH